MKSGCSGALKPDKLGSSCKVNKCSDAGTGDLDVLYIAMKHHHILVMSPQVQVRSVHFDSPLFTISIEAFTLFHL